MRLLEAIVIANQAAVAGKQADAKFECFKNCLPLAVLTCIDPRLNKLFPGALGLDEEQFIWLRNAGNVITSPTSSTVRSLTLAALVKGAQEIAIIGHTDCKMAKIGVADLLDRLKGRGIERTMLPIPNLQEFFGLFASEKPNVIKAVSFLRSSPIIPSKMPVHGLMIDTATGKLEWVVNGYTPTSSPVDAKVNLEEHVSSVLPLGTPGYVSGPLKSLAANLDPLAAKTWEHAKEKLAQKIEPLSPAPPSSQPPPKLPGKPGLKHSPYR